VAHKQKALVFISILFIYLTFEVVTASNDCHSFEEVCVDNRRTKDMDSIVGLIARCSSKPMVVGSKSVPRTATVIFIHGLGDTAHGWADIGHAIVDRFPWIRVILPTAPVRKVTLNHGMKMTAWYDIKSLATREGDDFDGLDEAKQIVGALITQETTGENPIPSSRIIVGGFSQGGALSIFSTYQFPDKLAGCIALSGYLPNHEVWGRGVTEINKDTPVLMCHGTGDPVVQYSWAKQAFSRMQEAGLSKTEFVPYEGMGHTACDPEIVKVFNFIEKNLPEEYSAQ